MKSVTIAVIITAVLAIATSYLYAKKVYTLRVLLKALSSAGFVFVGIFSLLSNLNADIFYAGCILGALTLGLMGDMFLSVHPFLDKKRTNLFNLLGMVSFILGHILYIALFTYYSGFYAINILYVAITPLVIVFLIKYKVIVAQGKSLIIIIYSIIISLMLVQGIYLHYLGIHSGSLFILLGSILFFLSDLALMLYNFSKLRKYRYLMSACLIMYYSAQVLLAYSIMLY